MRSKITSVLGDDTPVSLGVGMETVYSNQRDRCPQPWRDESLVLTFSPKFGRFGNPGFYINLNL